jgi:DNA gyrase subunit A
VIGIRLATGDEVVSMTVISDPEGKILFVAENGYGKRTKTKEFRKQNRGGKGIIAMKVTERTGKVVGALEVSDEDDVVLVSSDGILIRLKVKDISVFGRATQGVRLIRLLPGQVLAGVAKVVERDEEEQEN